MIELDLLNLKRIKDRIVPSTICLIFLDLNVFM